MRPIDGRGHGYKKPALILGGHVFRTGYLFAIATVELNEGRLAEPRLVLFSVSDCAAVAAGRRGEIGRHFTRRGIRPELGIADGGSAIAAENEGSPIPSDRRSLPAAEASSDKGIGCTTSID